MRTSGELRPGSIKSVTTGFTLVELLVVIAIIGVLVGLLLPAVQQARESARRMQCQNNLKQIGVAMHNYAESHGTLPVTFRGLPPGDAYNNANTGTSWITQLLPYTDKQALYDRIEFGESVTTNLAVAQTILPQWNCPSDSANPGRMTGRANAPSATEFGTQNYKAVAGSNWAWGNFPGLSAPKGRNAGRTNGLDEGNGVICRGGSTPRAIVTRLRDVTDGLKNTFFVGEAVPDWCNHTWWFWFNGSTATCGVPLNYQVANGSGFMATNRGDWPNNYSFMSQHVGGGHFLMGDGAVKFIGDSIEITTYRHLATISGEEIVSEAL
ncbi:Type II secretion system protein G precursor [Planctomycetes bacterium Pan216]|uniref:Type II secretion system protein G n=1 Tax=Kolteria novifilia TaxID=2527975 RepID=A0A518BA61_9BACT|nr:Type II secretion system protein G precursor [Planctomycetes bacterium Pan216]